MNLVKKLQNSEKRSFKGCKLLLIPLKKEIDEALNKGYSLRQIYFLMKEEYGFPYSYAQLTRGYNDLSKIDNKKEEKPKEKTTSNKDTQETKPDEKTPSKATWIPDHLKENHKKSDKPENDQKWVTINK